MHYKNGREAKAGDQVVFVGGKYSGSSAPPATGILHSVQAGADACNARLAVITPNDPYVTVSECLHIDDLRAAELPDSSK